MTERLADGLARAPPALDLDLDRLAAEELMRDAQKGASLAESHGSTAWKKSPVPKPNLNFLARAVSGTVIQNAWQDSRQRRDRRPSPSRNSDFRARNQTAQCHFRSEGLDHDRSSHDRPTSGRDDGERSNERRGMTRRQEAPRQFNPPKRDQQLDKIVNRRSRSPEHQKSEKVPDKKSRKGDLEEERP